MPTHVIDVPSKTAKSAFTARLLWHAFSFAYGTLSLVAYVLLAIFRKAKFRCLDDKSRKELANGMKDSPTLPRVNI